MPVCQCSTSCIDEYFQVQKIKLINNNGYNLFLRKKNGLANYINAIHL